MNEKTKIYKPKPVSGFPEWLPEERIVEQRWLDSIRRVFESYGYCSIETPSVEELDVIAAKGEVDKEIYILERLHRDANEKSEARLALHFDQTVPLARYVAQHFNDLVFPFKRYQMQRVWRGERPQMGRMREFTQCDIDVINIDQLPLSFDAEVAAVCYEAIASLNIGKVQLRISNRKILSGLLEFIERQDFSNEIFKLIDKKEKISQQQFGEHLKKLGDEKTFSAVQNFLDWATVLKQVCETNFGMNAQIEYIERHILNSQYVINESFKQGALELIEVIRSLTHLPNGTVLADLSIVRGLDYYTGTVYETRLLDVPEFSGSVCSGGRYDDLAGGYINKHLPGVGISIGFSRLFDVMRQTHPEKLGIGPKSPADILMVLPSEEERQVASESARRLRSRGYRVELYHAARKIPDQLKYATKKGIPFVWLPFQDGHKIKNMATGEQIDTSPDTWTR